MIPSIKTAFADAKGSKVILDNLSNYPGKIKITPLKDEINLLNNKNIYSEIESPNGRLGMYLRTNIGKKKKTDRFHTVRILSPDAANFIILKQILIGENQKNVPLIVHSLDLNFHMIDL